MNRPPQYESRYIEGNYNQEAPFFREAIALIDECTKLVKDDRIILRNKIKQYLRGLRENRLTENEEQIDYFNQLIHIFLEANKKKSLAKIQKGDRTMDWLQIKLRKFIDNTKKEKHKREIQNFKKGRAAYQIYRNHNHEQRSTSRRQADRRQILGASRGSNFQQDNSRHLIPSSLSRSRDKDPVESSRRKQQNKNSYASYSYHKNFSFLRKNPTQYPKQPKSTNKVEISSKNTKQKAQNTNIQNLNKSLDNYHHNNRSFNSSKSKGKEHYDFSNKLNKFTMNKANNSSKKQVKHVEKDQMDQQEINKLTQLFSKQLNSEESKNQSYHHQFGHLDSQIKSNPIDPLSERDRSHLDTYSRYEQSNKKIQEMLQGSKQLLDKISNHQVSVNPAPEPIFIQPQFTFKQTQLSSFKPEITLQPQFNLQQQITSLLPSQPEVTQNNMQIHPLNPPSKQSYNDLFTPPDFLAECRKFIEHSSKKKHTEQQWHDIPIPEQHLQKEHVMTFSNILSSNEKISEKEQHFNPFLLNQVTSQNVSQNISNKKAESQVQFKLRTPQIETIQKLLQQIFKDSHSVTMDRFKIGEIMSKCNIQTEKLLQKYCDVLVMESSNTNQISFNFISTLKYFYTFGKVFQEQDSYFAHFICSIIDINKNGFIGEQEINDFVQSMQQSDIQQALMNSIQSLLHSVFVRCCQVQGGGSMISSWSLYYLQLKGDQELCNLKELLNNFQFQVESD